MKWKSKFLLYLANIRYIYTLSYFPPICNIFKTYIFVLYLSIIKMWPVNADLDIWIIDHYAIFQITNSDLWQSDGIPNLITREMEEKNKQSPYLPTQSPFIVYIFTFLLLCQHSKEKSCQHSIQRKIASHGQSHVISTIINSPQLFLCSFQFGAILN